MEHAEAQVPIAETAIAMLGKHGVNQMDAIHAPQANAQAITGRAVIILMQYAVMEMLCMASGTAIQTEAGQHVHQPVM